MAYPLFLAREVHLWSGGHIGASKDNKSIGLKKMAITQLKGLAMKNKDNFFSNFQN